MRARAKAPPEQIAAWSRRFPRESLWRLLEFEDWLHKMWQRRGQIWSGLGGFRLERFCALCNSERALCFRSALHNLMAVSRILSPEFFERDDHLSLKLQL